MELNQIEAFVAVVQMKSFTGATHVLHLSQPAVSRRISLLEKELGITLFERIHEGIILTEAGQTFLPYAQKVLADIQDGIEAVRTTHLQEQGTVKLAIVGTLANRDFTDRLIRFRKQYPSVHLQLRTARSSKISDLVRSGAVHLGLRYFEDPDPEFSLHLVAEEPLVVVCSAYHAWLKPTSPHLDDLKGIAWVSFPIGQGSSGEPFARFQANQLLLHGLNDVERIFIDSLTAQKRLIEADFGIGLLPISSIQEELRLGTLHIISIPSFRVSAPIFLLHRKDGYLSKATRTLLAELVETDK